MSKYLASFSGKFGDVLWSLPVVREMSKSLGEPLDFAIMPSYESLLPLLNLQPYINNSMVLKNWHCTGSPHGDQPWQHPQEEWMRTYAAMFPLTYQSHPTIFLTLHIASSFAVNLPANPLPFLDTPGLIKKTFPYVAYAFNQDAYGMKCDFIKNLQVACPHVPFIDVAGGTWLEAADLVAQSIGFVGCRSANYVLAKGLDKRCLTFEPNFNRNDRGPFARVFGCPWGEETNLWHEAQLPAAKEIIDTWMKEGVSR